MCAFPQWAVWLPADRGAWTAVRPADSMPPGPEARMVWVRAGTAGELASLMQAADARLPPGEDQARRRPAAGGAPASRRLGQAGGLECRTGGLTSPATR